VLILHTVDWEAYSGLATDPGLTQRIAGDVLDLYEVDDAVAPVVTPSGDAAPRWWVRPLGSVDAPSGGVWLNDGAEGWMRGAQPLAGDGPGRLRLPAGGGLLWYWPSVLVLIADLVTLVVVGALCVKMRPSRRTGDYGVTRNLQEDQGRC
jgi:hypothetical protein